MEEKRLESYLEENEKILWRGAAKENDYLVCQMINLFPAILLWLAAECVILGVAVTNKIFGEGFNVYYLLLSLAAIVLHLIPTVLWFSLAVRENLRLRGNEYAVTESRVLVSRSTYRKDVAEVEIADVVDVTLRRSFGELITGTCRIVVVTEEENLVLYSVDGGSKTFKKVYRAVLGRRRTGDE